MNSLVTYIKRLLGLGEFRVLSGGETLSERSYAIQAWNGDVTLSASTTHGYDLSQGTLQQGSSITGEFDSFQFDSSSGVLALVYIL